jgi:calcium-dependent protein kinase
LLQEVTLLRRLDHENIIKLIEVFESINNIHLVLEHLNGGELFERIREKGSYSENDAAVIMKCLLKALVAMHQKQIVHRDLKPENMLFK